MTLGHFSKFEIDFDLERSFDGGLSYAGVGVGLGDQHHGPSYWNSATLYYMLGAWDLSTPLRPLSPQLWSCLEGGARDRRSSLGDS
jgi:hypothetical protein